MSTSAEIPNLIRRTKDTPKIFLSSALIQQSHQQSCENRVAEELQVTQLDN